MKACYPLYTASRCMRRAETAILVTLTLVMAVPWYVAEWTGLRKTDG